MPKVIEAEDLFARMVYSHTARPITINEVTSMVGPGWHTIVTELVAELLELGWTGELGQIKEKFGGLRFYAWNTTVAMDELIAKAEEQSFTICEDCGKPGRTDGWGGKWIKTLCKTHGEALEAEHEAQNP